ncbi:MAG: hypothetical protein GX159_00045 [Flavobacteriaceae bacterium]|jgi:hypothetical protein|nr:hypothetical protein [Flavobacteriaceae bacterium]
MKNLVFCFGLLLFAISCNNSKVVSSETDKLKNFEVIHQSEYGGRGVETTMVLTDQESFTKFWQETLNAYSDSQEIPSIDFNEKMVIAQHFQSRNSGGTTYEIISVNQSGNQTQVNYAVSSPEGMATMAITSPLLIVVVQKTSDPLVEFRAQN